MNEYNSLIPDILFKNNTNYSIYKLKKYLEEYNEVSTLLNNIQSKIDILIQRPVKYDLKQNTSNIFLLNLGITDISLFTNKTTHEKIYKIKEIIDIIENISLYNYLIKLLLCLLNEECMFFKKNKDNESLKYYNWIRRLDTVKIQQLSSYKNNKVRP